MSAHVCVSADIADCLSSASAQLVAPLTTSAKFADCCDICVCSSIHDRPAFWSFFCTLTLKLLWHDTGLQWCSDQVMSMSLACRRANVDVDLFGAKGAPQFPLGPILQCDRQHGHVRLPCPDLLQILLVWTVCNIHIAIVRRFHFMALFDTHPSS